jgi:hypothetical protein
VGVWLRVRGGRLRCRLADWGAGEHVEAEAVAADRDGGDEWAEQRRHMGLEILAKARRSNTAGRGPQGGARSDHRISFQRSRGAVFIHHEPPICWRR